jgi:hypothetical protein
MSQTNTLALSEAIARAISNPMREGSAGLPWAFVLGYLPGQLCSAATFPPLKPL